LLHRVLLVATIAHCAPVDEVEVTEEHGREPVMNDQAAPQAVAGGLTPEEIGQALTSLEAVWGDEYAFGHDPDKGWWVIKSGTIGSLLIRDTVQELNEALASQDGASR
jgi:hypothetical protein